MIKVTRWRRKALNLFPSKVKVTMRTRKAIHRTITMQISKVLSENGYAVGDDK